MAAAEVEAEKTRFREFLKIMGKGAGTKHEKQSWNDQFEAFMVGQEDIAQGPPADAEEEKKIEGENGEGNEVKESLENPFVDEKRLFVMNLSYQVTKEELQELFGKHGEIIDIEIPFRKHGKGVPLGIGFVRFAT